MSQSKAKLGVVGAGAFGSKCLAALRGLETFELVGVADRNASAAEQAGREYSVPAFADPRQLISQAQPDAVLVAAPPPAVGDLIRQAAKHGAHIIKPAPLARTLDEAVDLYRAVENQGLKFIVLSPRRYRESYRAMQTGLAKLGPLFLARAQYVLNWGVPFDWRADRASAGGGVLLEAGYEMIDLLVWTIGLPEEVYAVCGRKGRPHMVMGETGVEPLGVYDTDDTAIVSLRYADGLSGNVTTSWVTAPAIEQIMIHGHRGTLVAGPDDCAILDVDGNLLNRTQGEEPPLGDLRKAMERAGAALGGRTDRYDSSALEHMLTMSVVEAAYLSDRTGQPESPRRLLKARDIDPELCIRRPPR